MGKLNSAILHFYEIRAKKTDLKTVSPDELAVYGALSYIVNDLNVFSKLLLAATSLETKDKPIQFASDVQHNTLLRTLAGKVFEAHEFLRNVPTEGIDVDARIITLVRESTNEIAKLASDEGFGISRNMRNETAFHYEWKTARKNVRTSPEDLGASIFMNRLDGNTYFEFGEQLMFIERLRRFADANKKYDDVETLADAWLGWVQRAKAIIKKLHLDVVGIILEHLGNAAWNKRHYFVDPRLIAQNGEYVLPVFIEEEAT